MKTSEQIKEAIGEENNSTLPIGTDSRYGLTTAPTIFIR